MSNKMFDKIFLNRDNVNHPSHYNDHPSNVETIEIARELPFDLGNAWKYLMRFRYKGKPVEDMEKAVWYLNDYFNNMYNKEGEHAKAIKQQMYLNNEQFEDDLKRNKVTAMMLRVIDAEKDEYVRAALEMIATIAVYGTAQFINTNKVLTELTEHIPGVAKEEQFDQICDEAAEILDDLEKDDRARREADEKFKREMDEGKAKAATKGDVGPQTDEGLREMCAALKDVTDLEAELPEFEHRVNKPIHEVFADQTVNNENLIAVIVNNRNEVVPSTVELNPHDQYRTELVEVPADVLEQGHDAAVAFAEKLVTDRYGVKVIEEGSEPDQVMGDAH